MRIRRLVILLAMLAVGAAEPAHDDKHDDAVKTFRRAGQSAACFDSSCGYAVFPTIGKGGIGVGGAHGSGRVYERGVHVRDATMTQVTIGFPFGGQADSPIVCFQDERAFDEFTGGRLEFEAQASTGGIGGGANAGEGRAATAGRCRTGWPCSWWRRAA